MRIAELKAVICDYCDENVAVIHVRVSGRLCADCDKCELCHKPADAETVADRRLCVQCEEDLARGEELRQRERAREDQGDAWEDR